MSDEDDVELTLGDFAGGWLRVLEVEPSHLDAWRHAMGDPGSGAIHTRASLGDGVLDVIHVAGEAEDPFGRLIRRIERAGEERADLPAFAAFLARPGALDIGPGAAGAFFEPDVGEELFGEDRVLNLLVPGQEDVQGAWVTSAEDALGTPRDPIDASWVESIERARRVRSLPDRPGAAAALLRDWSPAAEEAIDAFLRALEPLAERDATVLCFWTWPDDPHAGPR